MEAILSREAQLNDQLNELMSDLRRFVSIIQNPRPSDQSWMDYAREVCEELARRLEEIQRQFKQTLSEKNEALSESLEELAGSFRSYSLEAQESFHAIVDDLGESLRSYASGLAERPNIRKLQELYQSMAGGYEELLVTLREMKVTGVRKLSRSAYLKPINYSRNLFHVFMGLGSVALYEFVLSHYQTLWIIASLATLVVVLEITRRMSDRWNAFLCDKIFGKVVRPFERHHINSSSYFVFALLFGCILFRGPVLEVGVIVLALADPAATITGKMWGRRKLFRDKSYIGSSVFLIVAWISVFFFIMLALPQLSNAYAALYAVLIAATGAVTEVLTTKIDDNFTIPLACSAMAFFLF